MITKRDIEAGFALRKYADHLAAKHSYTHKTAMLSMFAFVIGFCTSQGVTFDEMQKCLTETKGEIDANPRRN